MKSLHLHYNKLRKIYPEDNLIIVFDIDGTIIDTREIILYLLKKFDKENNKMYFQKINLEGITFHETESDRLKELFYTCKVPIEEIDGILAWYKSNFWNSITMLESNLPFSGVFEIIKWIQCQPNTFIGLNTGRSENIRKDTLLSLNNLGKRFNITIQNQLLFMNQGENVPDSKVRGLQYFEELGYKVICMVDNEPGNLERIQENFCINNSNVLLLHADTIFISNFEKPSNLIISGKDYSLSELVSI